MLRRYVTILLDILNAIDILFRKSLGNQQLEARGAYRNAQQRREDVQQIADTLRELAQLFSDVRSPLKRNWWMLIILSFKLE